MTVSSTTNRATFSGNGTTVIFAFPYYFLAQTDLLVTLTDSSGNITTKTLNSDYTITGTQAGNGTYPSGGSVVFGSAPASGVTVSVVRIPPDTQGTHWVDGDGDPSIVKETAFDKLTLLVQRAMDLLSRAPTLPDGFVSTFSPALPTVMTPNYGLVVNGAGTGFALVALAAAAQGTVTSVGLSLPGEFTVGSSPVTSSGTISASWATQVANRVFSGPTSGSAATPGFRALVAADIPQASLTPASMSSGAATSGQVPVANGSGGIAWLSLSGTGSVTSVAVSVPSALLTVSGTPITTSGTIALALAAQTKNFIFSGPSSGSNATPTFRALVAADLPVMGGASSGSDGTLGAVPAPTVGQQGYFLRGDGTWVTSPGTVNSVALSLPALFTVSGSPVTGSGTLSATLASQTQNTFFAAPNGSDGAPTFRGIAAADLPVYVGATNIASGTAGAVPSASAGQAFYVLRGNGTWGTAGTGMGTVTSVGLSLPADLTVSNSPVTDSGTLTAVWASQAKNLVHAGPTTGSNAAPTWRALVGTDLPNPSASTLGGIQSAVGSSHQWVNSISTLGVPGFSQPAFSDISGTLGAAQLPNPSASTLGGIQSYVAVTHQWINAISTLGVPSSAQPAFSDISGSLASSQLPAFSGGNVTSSAGSAVLTIGASQVTNAMLAGSIDLTAKVTGQLPVANGGTGMSTTTAYAVFCGGTTSTGVHQQVSGLGNSGQVLTSNGPSALPSWAAGLTNPMTTAGDIIVGGVSGAPARLAIGSAGQYLGISSGTPAWTSFKAPTIQRFTSSSGTYTTPAGVLYIRVEATGGGGGGAGSGTATGTAAGAGGNTTFGTTLIAANGGSGGGFGAAGGAGGSASAGSGPIGDARTGATGSGSSYTNDSGTLNRIAGEPGAVSALGGAGPGGLYGGAGGAAIANSGSGGGGAGGSNTAAFYTGSAGGAGGYVNALISSPSATYAYAVGAAGSAGAAGASGFAGGAGGSGAIQVTEYYA